MQHLNTPTRALPPVTDKGLFYIVVLKRVDGGVEVVTCEEKAARRINLAPAQYVGWEYVLVE